MWSADLFGVGVYECHFVEVCIADGRHHVSLGGTGRMDFNIESESLGGVGDFHCSREAGIVVGVDTYDVGGSAGDEVDVLFDAPDVFGLEQWSLDDFPKLFVAVHRDSCVFIGVFEPQEVGFVACFAEFHGFEPGVDFAGGVEHEVHLWSDGCSHGVNGFDFLMEVVVPPTVDFERGVAHFFAFDGEIGVRLRGVESAVAIAVHGRRVALELGSPAAE